MTLPRATAALRRRGPTRSKETAMGDADLLRRAATAMRERAQAARTPGPWRVERIDSARGDVRGLPENTSYDHRGDAVATAGDSEFGACWLSDAEHIAGMHPAVAIAVADWLDVHASDLAMADGNFSACDSPADTRQALAVARAYLQESP